VAWQVVASEITPDRILFRFKLGKLFFEQLGRKLSPFLELSPGPNQ
jgi:hypothetical protein